MPDPGLPRKSGTSMEWHESSVPVGSLIRIDSQGVVVKVCGAHLDVFVCHEDDAVGQQFLEVIDPRFRDAVERVRTGLRERADRGQSEIGVERDGEDTVSMWEVAAYCLDDGDAIVVVRDLGGLAALRKSEQSYVRRLRDMAITSENVAQEERRVLAIELHDRVSQPLAAARLRLQEHDRLHRGMDIVPREAQHREVLGLLDAAIAESRAITSELAPVVYYELGIASALHALADDVEQKHGMRCSVQCDEVPGVNPREGITAFVYRAARELLTNVHKHARTSDVSLQLHIDSDDVRLTVRDHGVGFDVAEALYSDRHPDAGFGLFSIREHAERLGGDLTLSSIPGEGTCAVLTVPLES